jgi:glutamate dehydrogenase
LGLGILSRDYLTNNPAILHILTTHTDRMRFYDQPFVFSRMNFSSPIQRFEKLMRLSLKFPSEKGGQTEYVFVGLLRQSSLFAKNTETPLIHLKMSYIFETKNMLPGSYDYNEVIHIFTSIPKFELFRRTREDLLQMVEDLLSISNPNEVFCFTRKKLGNKLPVMVVLPHRLYSPFAVEQIVSYLKPLIPHTDIEILDIHSEDHARLQLYFEQTNEMSPDVDCAPIEASIRELIKPWEERFRDALFATYEFSEAQALYHRYSSMFPNHYRARCLPKDTLRDVYFLEKMHQEGTMQFDVVPFFMPGSASSGNTSLLTIYHSDKIPLISIMPILENMGFQVFDEMTTRVGTSETMFGYLHSFRFKDSSGQKVDEASYGMLLVDLLAAVFSQSASNDRLNGLVLSCGLNWRSVTVLECYRNAFFQISSGAFTREKITSTLLNHPASTAILFEYFDTKFSMDARFGSSENRLNGLLPDIETRFLESLHRVSEVSEDLIFRRLLNLVQATLRTNFYIPKTNRDAFVSIKIDSSAVHQMPQPAPYREIYVYDAGVEGCHLRFGPVARGGLRWSNRPDDFRKEVLDLVKTQQTKNVVIVPVGSKGGFIVKLQNEPIQYYYEKFVAGLLDITDNFDVSGQVQHPQNVVVYDGLDPYLVVAADKGTASFSDFANSVSARYHFWLGDAFASGGTYGYNHKAVGVTAKGGWECVKLHFKEMGKDIQKEPFTVAAIGDMSGDVFGNGMLLSKEIQLVAAFNHAHIFLDPDPPIEASWKERERLFNLPTSTWESYDASLISKGGGIFLRKAKEITLTPQIKHLLDVDVDVDVMTGEELISAILRMQVELLWFGGIGTYIKASHQTHLSVGDPANDAVRIDSTECQARVIGEGANLGITQSARIELNQRGVRTNTDAIDNSAGVNMSDYEVNIKILLNRLMRENVVASMDDRNALLTEMTDRVTDLCLTNNRRQHRLLSLDELRSKTQLSEFSDLLAFLVSHGLNTRTESIPDASLLAESLTPDQKVPRCILAVMQAYVKMWVYDSLLASPIMDQAYFNPAYLAYFPSLLTTKFPDQIQTHQLKKEILCTAVTNHVVNHAGMTFYHHMAEKTGRDLGEITLAYLLIGDALGKESLYQSIFGQPGVSETDKYAALLLVENAVQTLTRDLLQVSMIPLTVEFSQMLSQSFKTIYGRLSEEEKTKIAAKFWVHTGYPNDIALLLAVLARPVVLIDLLYMSK